MLSNFVTDKLKNERKKKNIFINYASEDLVSAQKLHNILKFDFKVWFDKESLLPGQDWEKEIEKAIENSDYVILLFSSTSINKKGMVQKEYKLALEVLKKIPFGQIFIIPVRLNYCKIPIEFQKYQYVDLFPEWKNGIDKILSSLGIYSFDSNFAVRTVIRFEFNYDKQGGLNVELFDNMIKNLADEFESKNIIITSRSFIENWKTIGIEVKEPYPFINPLLFEGFSEIFRKFGVNKILMSRNNNPYIQVWIQ